MRKFLIIAMMSVSAFVEMQASAIIPEETVCSPPFEISEMYERHELVVSEAVTVPATPDEVSVSETISNYAASVPLIAMQHFYRPILYEPGRKNGTNKSMILSWYQKLLCITRSRASPKFFNS
ncbi:hypothetical protein [Flavobacterium beibuense]|uniref:hypothetical protein n=1 Tax=Flavobacterium beibuense TaxID=657326 RepID=UPI003A910EC3